MLQAAPKFSRSIKPDNLTSTMWCILLEFNLQLERIPNSSSKNCCCCDRTQSVKAITTQRKALFPLPSSTWLLDLNVLLNFDHRFCNRRLDSSTSFILPQLRLQTDSSSIFHLILRPNFSQLRLEILRSSISFFDLSLFFASWFQILSSSTWFFELRFFPNSPQILCDPPLDSSSFAGWIWMWSRMRILDQEWRAHFIIHPWGRPGPPERVCLQERGWFCLSGHGTKSGNEIGLSGS